MSSEECAEETLLSWKGLTLSGLSVKKGTPLVSVTETEGEGEGWSGCRLGESGREMDVWGR